MIEPSPITASLLTGARAETKAFLRIDTADEDGLLDQFLADAAALAEAFTGQALFIRPFREILPARRDWSRLSIAPVRAVMAVDAVPVTGSPFALAADRYVLDIDAQGDAWVRVPHDPGTSRVSLQVSAGLAADWASLPEPVRLGILRLAAHFYSHRDAPDDAGPPAAVAALLRPWRRMRLS